MSLSGNTEKINALISAINALPEAGSGGGSGGSVETCTVTLKIGSIPSPGVGIGTVYFVQADESHAEINIDLLSSAATIEVLQNSIVALDVSLEGLSTTNCELLFKEPTYNMTKACAIYIGAVDLATIKVS